jgi:hypothetical protein
LEMRRGHWETQLNKNERLLLERTNVRMSPFLVELPHKGRIRRESFWGSKLGYVV